MKITLNQYHCKCGWRGTQPYGGGGMRWDADGNVQTYVTKSHCPFCGSEEIELKSEKVDLIMMNSAT
jgi:predicted RNA-binding Zn-ribbon protein involved in translation (DUF1610 family)